MTAGNWPFIKVRPVSRPELARNEALEAGDELGVGEASERSEDVVLHARVVARTRDTLRKRAHRGRG